MADEVKTLRAGVVIEYTHPVGICGDPQWLRCSEIIGVDPYAKRSPINLGNEIVLDEMTVVKRIRIMFWVASSSHPSALYTCLWGSTTLLRVDR